MQQSPDPNLIQFGKATVRARSQKTTVSELVREAVHERYPGNRVNREERLKAMREFIGSRKDELEPVDAVEYVRSLRRGDRIDRLMER